MATTNNASAFTITELSGPPDERNVIVLTRRALPFRPFTLKGTQRGEVAWYQGNPVGVVQIFGPSEEPTTINGKWHDTYIVGTRFATLNGIPLADVRAIVVAVDNMRRQGKTVQVTWDEEVREGYIKSFEYSWDRRTDVTWSLEFDWSSRGEAELPPIVSPATSVSEVSQRTRALIEDIGGELFELDFPATGPIQDAISDNLTKLKERQAELQAVVSAALANALAPLDAARGAAAALTRMADDALQFSRKLQSEVLFSMRSGATAASFTVGGALAIARTIRTVQNSLRQLRNTALVQKAKLLQDSDGNVLQELIGIEGDDLRRVAQSVYGASADWRLIALFNNVRTSKLAAGQKLVIPRPGATR